MIIPMARSTPAPDPRDPPGARRSIAVIRTYLRDQDPEIRKNAAAALAAIGDGDAIDALIDMAIDEEHPKVRDAVERHLVEVDGNEGRLGPLLQKKLETRGGQASEMQSLLGRLRLRGLLQDDRAATQALIDLARAAAPSPLRQRAEDTLAGLTDERAVSATVEELDKALSHPDPAVRSATYTLLGRLRMQGARVAASHLYARNAAGLLAPFQPAFWRRLFQRCRTATAVSSDARVADARRFSWLFVWAVVSAAACGAVVMATYLTRILNPPAPDGFYPILTLGITLIGLCAGVLATRRAVPVYLHFDRLAGGVIEVANAALWVAGPTLVGVSGLLLLLNFSGGLRTWITLLAAGTIAIIVFVAAVRAGTIIGFGGLIEPEYEAKDKATDQPSSERGGAERSQAWRWVPSPTRLNQMVELFAGTAAGILAFGVLVWLGRRGLSDGVGSPLARLVEGLWVFVLPAAGAVAMAFTSIDTPVAHVPQASEPAGRRPPAPASRSLFRLWRHGADGPGWTRRVACVLLLLTLPVVLAAVSNTNALRITDLAADGERVPLSIWLNSAPASFDFRVAFPQKVHIEVPDSSMVDKAGAAARLAVTLYKWQARAWMKDGMPVCEGRTDKRLIQRRDAPAPLDVRVGWGCYSIEVETLSGDITTGRSVHVASVLDTLTKAGAASNVYMLSVTLNADKQRRDMPAESAVAAAPPRRGVWFVETLSAHRTLTLTQPTCIAAGASPEGGVTPILPRPTAGRRRAEFFMNVDLWRGSERMDLEADSSNVTYGTVGAGTYEVRITRTDDKKKVDSGFIALNVTSSPVESQAPVITRDAFGSEPPAAQKESSLTGHWNLDTLPAKHTFVVHFPQRIIARIPRSAVVQCEGFEDQRETYDFTLRLLQQADGELKPLEKSDDDPEEIDRVVQPGTYELEVSGYGAGNVRLPELSPRPVLELVLNAAPKKAAPKTN